MDKILNTTLSREEQLKADGWSRNCLIDEPRLSEIVKLHEELGFEVLLEPAYPSVCKEQECTSCFQENPDSCKIVYIRRPKH